MFKVIGSLNVAPGVVEQFSLAQLPCSQAQLLISTVIFGSDRAPPAKRTRPPNSDVLVAS